MVLEIQDILRMLVVCGAFLFGYRIGFTNGYDPMAQLHFMIPVIITAIALLSYAVIAITVYFTSWGTKAELTIFFDFIFFFIFSAANHAVDAIRRKNYKWQNINRPFITLLLIAGMIYPVIMALKILQ